MSLLASPARPRGGSGQRRGRGGSFRRDANSILRRSGGTQPCGDEMCKPALSNRQFGAAEPSKPTTRGRRAAGRRPASLRYDLWGMTALVLSVVIISTLAAVALLTPAAHGDLNTRRAPFAVLGLVLGAGAAWCAAVTGQERGFFRGGDVSTTRWEEVQARDIAVFVISGIGAGAFAALALLLVAAGIGARLTRCLVMVLAIMGGGGLTLAYLALLTQ